MTRRMFGWSLPPGCTHRHIEEAFGDEGPCQCCGHDVTDCICPECPICNSYGDPSCYDPGHESDDVRLSGKLEYNQEQLAGQAKMQEYLRQQGEEWSGFDSPEMDDNSN